MRLCGGVFVSANDQTQSAALFLSKVGFVHDDRRLVAFPHVDLNLRPSVPTCVASGDVRVRYTTHRDLREWKCIILAGCDYNLGGADMVSLTVSAECRIAAVDKESHLVGAVCVKDVQGWIPFITCAQSYRGMGLGSYLLFLAMEWVRCKGGHEVRLSPLTSRVINFYRKWGFTLRQTTKKQKRQRFEDCEYVMRRLLPTEDTLIPGGGTLEEVLAVTPLDASN